MTTSPILYDPSTDSMYVTIRDGRVVHTVTHDENEYAVDIGEDGGVIGYDIQFASRHPDIIAEALRLLQHDAQQAA